MKVSKYSSYKKAFNPAVSKKIHSPYQRIGRHIGSTRNLTKDITDITLLLIFSQHRPINVKQNACIENHLFLANLL